MSLSKTDWLTLDEISAQCGLSTRTLRRRLEEPRNGVTLETDYRSIPGRKPLLIVSPESVEIIAAEVLHPVPLSATNGHSAIVKKTNRDTDIMPQGDIVTVFQALQRARFNLPPRPWLTVPEAAEWSGLPEKMILEALREKRLHGFKHRGWHVHSDNLVIYSDRLKDAGAMSRSQMEE